MGPGRGVHATAFGFLYGGPLCGSSSEVGGDTTIGAPPLPLQTRAGCRARLSLCFQVVEKGGPYPLIVLPQFGGYWIEDPENVGTPTSLGSSICEEEEEDSFSPSTFGYKLECKSEARAYRRHFLGKVRPGPGESGCRGGLPGEPSVSPQCPLSALPLPRRLPLSSLERSAWLCSWAGGRGVQEPRGLNVMGPCGDRPQQMF